MYDKHWFMKVGIPIHIWNEMKIRNIVNNNLDEFITNLIKKELERIDKEK